MPTEKCLAVVNNPKPTSTRQPRGNRGAAPIALSSARVSCKIFLPPSREMHQESVLQQENLPGLHRNLQVLLTKQPQRGGFSAHKYFPLVKWE